MSAWAKAAKKPFRMCSTPHTKGLFTGAVRCWENQTNSIIAVSAASPRRTPVRVMRV